MSIFSSAIRGQDQVTKAAKAAPAKKKVAKKKVAKKAKKK